MGLFKRGNIWWIAVTVNGKQQRFSTKTSDKKQAELIYSQVLLELNQNQQKQIPQQLVTLAPQPELTEPVKESSMTFEEFYQNHYLKWCYKRQAAYETKKYYLNSIPDWFKELRLNQITLKEVELLQNYFMSKFSISTSNRYLRVLKASMTKAYDWGFITEQRLKNIRKVKELKGENKRLRYLNEDEIQRLLNACDKHIYPIVFVALHTGMRKSEILNLKWSQIDFKNELILLEKTKNGERREIPMDQLLKTLLLKLFTERRLDSDYVFISYKTGKPYHRNLNRSFYAACKKAGIRDFHFHDLRHTFASQLVMSGTELKTVQELLGHKDLKMTLRYAHLSPAHKKQAVERLAKKIHHNLSQFYHNLSQ